MTTIASDVRAGAASSHPGLVWSDYGYLLGAAVAAVVVVNPFDWDAARNTPAIRHLALLISVLAVLLTVAGRQICAPLQRAEHGDRLLRVAWPLLVLAMLIIGGGTYARFVDGIQNTFLVVGLYMMGTFCAAMMVLKTGAPGELLRGYFRIIVAAAVIMGFYLIVNFGVRQVYHEQIFLVIPMAAVFIARPGHGILRWLGCGFFLSMTWYSPKYTSYLIGVLTVVYLAFVVALPRLGSRSGLYKVTLIYWSFMTAALIAAVFAYFALRGAVELPSGNPEYRLHTYLGAWERFKESPLWGTLFSVEAVEKFTPYSIGIAGNVLPTHSDILDFMAHGGIIAMLLWLFGLVRILRFSFGSMLHPKFLDHPWAPYAHTLALMSLAGVVTYSFNPILLQPSLAYLLWTNLGLLLGLALRAGDSRTGA